MDETVLSATSDRVGMVTLNRPDARNAMNSELQRALAIALVGAESDEGVDVVILTGADPATTKATSGDMPVLWTMTKPVIGAINGPAVTGGFELALGCDFLIASERATFGDTHARVGVTPGGGMSVFLPQTVGLRKAKEMSLTGNFIDAREALELRLVNHVVAHDELLPTARRLAADIVGNDQHAVRNLKQLYDSGSKLSVGDAIALEQERFRSFRVDPSEIERRRANVVERGRGQTK